MLELTVKTLDSQDYSYTVPDDITVKQFKEKISSSVKIPPDKQRLIYFGKVLQDDKKLADYDVHGKVIHLVQRPPPQASHASTSAATSNNQSSSTTSSGVPLGRLPREGNSFLLGAFTIPSDVTEPNHVQQIVQQIVSGMGELGRNATVMSRTSDDGSSVDVHINLGQVPTHREARQVFKQAQRMIRLANQTLERLNNSVRRDASRNSEESNANATGTSVATPSTSVTEIIDSVMMDLEANRGQASSEASENISLHQVRAESTEDTSQNPEPSDHLSDNADMEAEPAEAAAQSSVEDDSPNAHNSEESESEALRNPRGITRDARPFRTRFLGRLMADIIQLQSALQPHLERYQDILTRCDDRFTGQELQAAQQTYNSVSEILHYLSHAYHAISELVVNFVQCTPRSLLAYPMNIQQPTAISIPIQAQINVSATASPSTTRSASPSRTTSTTTASVTSLPSGNQTSTVTENHTETSSATAASASGASSSTPVTSVASATTTSEGIPQMASLFSSQNPILFMEVGPGNITIDSFSATMMSDSAATTQSETGARTTVHSITVPPPPELLQNLMQAMGQVPFPRASANGQSQARGNTATNTTTSTQTRSTARPVQTIPVAFPGFGLSCFDRFLPCSSRHIFSRQMMTIQPRTSSSQNTRQQSGQSPGASVDNQLGNLVTNLMSALIGSNVQVQGSHSATTNSASSSQNNTGSVHASPVRIQASSIERERSLAENFISVLLQNFMEPRSENSNRASDASSGTSGQITPVRPNLIGSLLRLINSHFSQAELMDVIQGRSEPLNRMQACLREFVLRILLSDHEPSDENITNAIEDVVDIWRVFLQAAANEVNVKDGIDYIGTMNNFVRRYLREFIELVLNSEENFGSSLYNFWMTSMNELIVLNISCFQDGQQSLERLVHAFLQALNRNPNNQLNVIFVNLGMMSLRTLISSIRITEDQVQHHIVRYAGMGTEQAASHSNIELTKSEQKVKSEKDSASSEVPMETDVAEEIPPINIEAGRRTSSSACLSGTGNRNGNETEDDSLMISPASWHEAVPVEWVPIITKDVQRQRRHATQSPFSDAYLEGMPSKRRKIMASHKLQASVDFKTSLSEALRHSIQLAGAQPLSTLEEVTQDLYENDILQNAYVDQMKDSIRRRLQSDPDYHPRKFPNTENFFFSELENNKK